MNKYAAEILSGCVREFDEFISLKGVNGRVRGHCQSHNAFGGERCTFCVHATVASQLTISLFLMMKSVQQVKNSQTGPVKKS